MFKAPREVTHDRRLRDVDDVIAAFVDLLAPLDDLLGGITLQLPPSFGPSDLDALDAVLRQAPSAVRWSVEVRHPEFFGGDGRRRLETLLAANRAERVLLDTSWLFHRTPRTEAGHEEWRTKPRVPVLTDGLTDRPVVRFIGGDEPDRIDAGLEPGSKLDVYRESEGKYLGTLVVQGTSLRPKQAVATFRPARNVPLSQLRPDELPRKNDNVGIIR